MIGMVLVTHGQLATGFRAALEHVVGPQSQLETITIGPEDDMEQRRSDILERGGARAGRQRRRHPDRHVRRHALESGDFGDGRRPHRSDLRRQPADVDQARDDARNSGSRPCGRRGARRRPQIHHHREQGAGRANDRGPSPRKTARRAPELAGALAREMQIVNRKGLHARATAKFVQCVDRFDADVKVTRCGETVGGNSIMGILTLGAGARIDDHGVRLAARKRGALDALDGRRFGEDE